MSIRVTTRHGEDFDILTDRIDLTKSPYARYLGDEYVRKVTAFYEELGTMNVLWTTPESQPPIYFESDKPIEYLLEVDEHRVVAYVNEKSWSPYLYGRRSDFEYSCTPAQYDMTSVLVAAPVRRVEVRERRRYGPSATGHCQLIEQTPFADRASRSLR